MCCNCYVGASLLTHTYSLQKLAMFFCYLYIIEKVPVRPSNVTIGSTGSHWAEVSWISADDDVTSSNFHIEYHQNGAEDGTMLSTNRIFPLLAECNMYSAIITDLIPASKYFFKVIVQNRNSANESEVKEFTTNEAGM